MYVDPPGKKPWPASQQTFSVEASDYSVAVNAVAPLLPHHLCGCPEQLLGSRGAPMGPSTHICSIYPKPELQLLVQKLWILVFGPLGFG